MALPDPIPTLTVNAVTYDFARVGMADGSSVYQTANGLDRVSIGHQDKARSRTTLRVDRRKVAADPFNAALNQEYSISTYVVSDAPKLGVTQAERDYHSQLLTAFMVAGTPDYWLRILQGEI